MIQPHCGMNILGQVTQQGLQRKEHCSQDFRRLRCAKKHCSLENVQESLDDLLDPSTLDLPEGWEARKATTIYYNNYEMRMRRWTEIEIR